MGKLLRSAALAVAAMMAMAFSAIPPAYAGKDQRAKASVKKRLAAKKKAVARKAAARPPVRGHKARSHADAGDPLVRSASALVADPSSGEVLFEKNPDAVLPIASITKLMTAMVVLDAGLDSAEPLAVTEQDVDLLRGSGSRLAVGSVLPRAELLRLALMSSENRAAHALSRNYPGGTAAFVAAMNRKAREIGLSDTRFSDPTGLAASNVSSARDLAKMVGVAARYPAIREFTTTAAYTVELKGRAHEFRNTNVLVRNSDWEIGVSKTGYISEAGRCLVMMAQLAGRPVIIVLLDSWGKLTRIGDANRIRRWVENGSAFSRAG
ncbi:MAG: hypothetical protein OHK0026_07650 [Rhodocyclaceae bacterium]